MRVLLISTYDLGRQPFGLASAAAAVQAVGADVSCLDLAKERLDESRVAAADAIAFFLPMHTATRLALPVIKRVRAINPAARLCAARRRLAASRIAQAAAARRARGQ